MGDRRDEAENVVTRWENDLTNQESVFGPDFIKGDPQTYQGWSLRMAAVLIGAIEDLKDHLVVSHLAIEDRLAALVVAVDEQPEPLTAEESIPQTDAIMELLRRKQELNAERKARVSKENPPRAMDKNSDD